MPTLDHHVQEVQEWQLSQEGKIKRREDVHQEGHFVMTSQKTYQWSSTLFTEETDIRNGEHKWGLV